jgi:hypothetical protein
VFHSTLNSLDLEGGDEAELDLYDTRIARAHEIVNRRRQEWDLESDSELSVLASSQFNGMEGIELGGGTEVGDGIESSSIQGTDFSLRWMRSGKVVRYRDE